MRSEMVEAMENAMRSQVNSLQEMARKWIIRP